MNHIWYRLVMVTHVTGETSLWWTDDRDYAIAMMREHRERYGLRYFLRKVTYDGRRLGK